MFRLKPTDTSAELLAFNPTQDQISANFLVSSHKLSDISRNAPQRRIRKRRSRNTATAGSIKSTWF